MIDLSIDQVLQFQETLYYLPECRNSSSSLLIQAQIDHYYGLVSKQIKDVLGK